VDSNDLKIKQYPYPFGIFPFHTDSISTGCRKSQGFNKEDNFLAKYIGGVLKKCIIIAAKEILFDEFCLLQYELRYL